MFFKPLAFILLALACVTAAAGGAYVATRRNAAPATVASAPATPPASAKATPAVVAAHPAVETAAPVSSPARPAERDAQAKAHPSTTATTSARVDRSTRPTAPAASVAPVPAAPQTDLPQAGTPVSAQSLTMPSGDAAAPPDPEPLDASGRAFEDIVVPASSIVGVQIETPISSEYAQVEDRVLAHVTRDVLADGRVAIPAGARVIGSVTLVDHGGKMKTPARLGIRFHTLILADGSEIPLRTQEITRDGESPGAESAKKVGGAAIVGAILGGILGGGKGAVIGGTAGAGAGTAAVMAGDQIPAVIAQGATFNVRLAAAATIQVER